MTISHAHTSISSYETVGADGDALTSAQRALLPTLNMDDFSNYLVQEGLSDSNRKSVLRVARKLVSGEGITHQNKPGSSFHPNDPITLAHDLHALQAEAEAWLPYKKGLGDACLDKGHGWALNTADVHDQIPGTRARQPAARARRRSRP